LSISANGLFLQELLLLLLLRSSNSRKVCEFVLVSQELLLTLDMVIGGFKTITVE
jgi:hypothetical protein